MYPSCRAGLNCQADPRGARCPQQRGSLGWTLQAWSWSATTVHPPSHDSNRRGRFSHLCKQNQRKEIWTWVTHCNTQNKSSRPASKQEVCAGRSHTEPVDRVLLPLCLSTIVSLSAPFADNVTVTIVSTLCATICVSAPSCVIAIIVFLTIFTILCGSVSGGRNKRIRCS